MKIVGYLIIYCALNLQIECIKLIHLLYTFSTNAFTMLYMSAPNYSLHIKQAVNMALHGVHVQHAERSAHTTKSHDLVE